MRGADEQLVGARALAEPLEVDLERPIGTLSRENRQKIGVIQAVAHEPEVLVLDEPTSGLDPVVQRTFRMLVRAAADRGAAVLLSSHVLAEVQRLVDRVAIIRSGRLVAVEPMHELEAKALRVLEIRFAGPVPRPSVRDEYQKLVQNYPEALLAFFGIDKAGLGTAAGYLQAELCSLIVPLAFAGYMIAGGSAATAGEQEAGSLVEGLRRFRPMSPFWWYSGRDPLSHGIEPLPLALLTSATLIFLAAAVVAFDRRDVA